MAKYKVNLDGVTATNLETGESLDLKTLKPDSYRVVGSDTTIPPKQKLPLSNKISNFFGGKGVSDALGATLAQKQNPDIAQYVERPTGKEVAGSALQLGANFLPGAGVGAKFGTKLAVGAGTGYAFDVGSKLQSDNTITDSLKPGIGTTVGVALPVAGAVVKPAVKIVGRLFKGLGSGLSGVSTETIEKIYNNPKAAQVATDRLNKTGNSRVLEENARQIMNGVSAVKKEARQAFRKGLDELAETDIKPDVFRGSTQKVLDKYGSTVSNGKRILSNVEFDDPKNIAKASSLIDKLQSAELNGRALRKLADDIDSAKYKVVTGSNEKMSFNSFLDDLSGELKGAITSSTGKLDEINASFSKDMQLAEAIEKEFGKVRFKNLSEVVAATKRVEQLFAKKGIAPDVIDDFLNRIGQSPDEFKTTEAVRQISNKTMKANEPGTSLGEMTRSITSAIVTPQAVRDISIKLGLAEDSLLPELRKLSTPVRKALLNFLVQNNK